MNTFDIGFVLVLIVAIAIVQVRREQKQRREDIKRRIQDR